MEQKKAERIENNCTISQLNHRNTEKSTMRIDATH